MNKNYLIILGVIALIFLGLSNGFLSNSLTFLKEFSDRDSANQYLDSIKSQGYINTAVRCSYGSDNKVSSCKVYGEISSDSNEISKSNVLTAFVVSNSVCVEKKYSSSEWRLDIIEKSLNTNVDGCFKGINVDGWIWKSKSSCVECLVRVNNNLNPYTRYVVDYSSVEPVCVADSNGYYTLKDCLDIVKPDLKVCGGVESECVYPNGVSNAFRVCEDGGLKEGYCADGQYCYESSDVVASCKGEGGSDEVPDSVKFAVSGFLIAGILLVVWYLFKRGKL
ncbi:MAG: hypothetical protein KKB65_01755 [Nanoarchaeota archaeon]|nr:hypothetical protein [Nanoarchaeota archaeon]